MEVAQLNGLPVATRYTHDFVRAQLPRGARDVLEIGCGTGELAAELLKDGLAVVAIDSNGACVAEALRRGVDASQLVWPVDLGRHFDCVLFTRSLHHMDDLDASLAAAQETLRPAGRLVIEDFRAEGVKKRSIEWYAGMTRTLFTSGAFTDDFDLHERIAAAGPDHDHGLHSSSAIAEALRRLARVKEEESAYFFRYLEGRFRQPSAAEELFRYEIALIEAGVIDPLGKRFIASD